MLLFLDHTLAKDQRGRCKRFVTQKRNPVSIVVQSNACRFNNEFGALLRSLEEPLARDPKKIEQAYSRQGLFYQGYARPHIALVTNSSANLFAILSHTRPTAQTTIATP